MAAVVSMYEDQFDLCTLRSKLIEECRGSEAENFGWWKKLSFRRSGPILSLRFVEINHITVPVKRTKELRALIGWYVLLLAVPPNPSKKRNKNYCSSLFMVLNL